MDDFNWPGLANQGSQRRHIDIVGELSYIDLECGHIEEGYSVFVSVLLDREDIL